MKRLILSIAILVGLSVPAQAETNYREWAQFIDKTWDCKDEIKQAGQFTGCSGFAIDYMHLMEDPEAVGTIADAPTEWQKQIQEIMGIDPENPDPAQAMKIMDHVMVVALDFMCYAPEGKAWMVDAMISNDTQAQTSIASSLMAISIMNSMFCNLPVDTDYSQLLGNL